MISITAGEDFSCALVASTGRARCWGQIFNRQHSLPPEDLVFHRIFGGSSHVCGILLESREALCWGNNEHGQCDPPQGITISAMAAGIEHTCGLRDDTHQAICWGDNKYGQLGAPSDLKLSTIAAGDWYTCGVTLNERQLVCWGTVKSPRALRVKDGLCVAACDEEQYEALSTSFKDCSSLEDKICLTCARCKSGSYESSPCVPFSDRICTDCSWCFKSEKADHPCRKVCTRGPTLPVENGQAAQEPSTAGNSATISQAPIEVDVVYYPHSSYFPEGNQSLQRSEVRKMLLMFCFGAALAALNS